MWDFKKMSIKRYHSSARNHLKYTSGMNVRLFLVYTAYLYLIVLPYAFPYVFPYVLPYGLPYFSIK